MRELAWSYEFEDGGSLKLYDTPDEYILFEYDANGRVVGGSYYDGRTMISYTEVYYPKDTFTLDQAIASIEKEYYI